jgi:hypothetical protein
MSNNEERKIQIPDNIEDQINEMKKRDLNISSNMEDIMIDLHNNCEFMGDKMSSLFELIKDKTDEEIKASTVNYRKAYDTLLKVAMMIGLSNSIIIVLLIFILLK